MKKENQKERIFTRRTLFIGALQAALLCVLGGRLAWLQITQGAKYKTLSEKNRININMLSPSRGLIYDRYGTPLAVNDENFRVLVIPEQTENLEKALSKLQKLIEISQSDIKRVLKQASRSAAFVPLEVKDKLSWQEVAQVEVNLPDLPGVAIDVGEIRSYPYGVSTAHITGYVGAVTEAEVKTGDPIFKLPGFKVGRTGLEKAFDKKLRGSAGSAEVEVNVVGRQVRELKRHEGLPGKDLTLTIDADLQIYMQERLSQEKSASAVIMDVHTGAVYGLFSSPAFDVNLFTTGLSAEKWEELNADPGLPLNNKAVSGQYPPGSTFKMVTALAALEEGYVTRNKTVYCPGHYDYGGDRFHCWKRGGHGTMNLVSALAESCDTYFYEIATEIGIDTLAAYAKKLGLGDRLDFDLTEEAPGLMPTIAWKRGHFGKAWQPGETIVSSIGQGYLLTTPLQLATMTARLVNGGKQVKPWLTAYTGRIPTHDYQWPVLNLSKKNLDLIGLGMSNVVNDPDGTAYAARIQNVSMAMAGKTGTAQVRRITMEERSEGVLNSDLPWKLRHHALFVGYAPVGNPRYACAVVVDHGGSGSAAAAPIARDLLTKVQQRDPASKPVYLDQTSAAQPTPTRKPMQTKQNT